MKIKSLHQNGNLAFEGLLFKFSSMRSLEDNNSCPSHNDYYVPSTVLSAFHVLPYSVITTDIW